MRISAKIVWFNSKNVLAFSCTKAFLARLPHNEVDSDVWQVGAGIWKNKVLHF